MISNHDQDQQEGGLIVGRNTYWQPTCRFTVHHGEIRIGRYCSFAHSTVVIAGGEHRHDCATCWDTGLFGVPNPRPIGSTYIGHDVWLGDGAFVGHGARVGNGAILGARAVVMKDVPPYAVVAGNPAKIIRFRHAPRFIEALERIAWWNWPLEQVRERVADLTGPIEQFIDRYGG